MEQEKKLVTVDEILEGVALFDEELYIKTENEIRLKDEISEKEAIAAKHRWENGGKEIYEKWQANPDFAETEEWKNYFKKWGLPILDSTLMHCD